MLFPLCHCRSAVRCLFNTCMISVRSLFWILGCKESSYSAKLSVVAAISKPAIRKTNIWATIHRRLFQERKISYVDLFVLSSISIMHLALITQEKPQTKLWKCCCRFSSFFRRRTRIVFTAGNFNLKMNNLERMRICLRDLEVSLHYYCWNLIGC
jgi:uncharacterized membrane protein